MEAGGMTRWSGIPMPKDWPKIRSRTAPGAQVMTLAPTPSPGCSLKPYGPVADGGRIPLVEILEAA